MFRRTRERGREIDPATTWCKLLDDAHQRRAEGEDTPDCWELRWQERRREQWVA